MTPPRPDAGSPHAGRSTRAEIDLDAFTGNVRCVRALLSPATELMAVVKANGYGHGAVPISRLALAAGAARLAVATVGEGAELRRGGITAPILVLGPIEEREVESALSLDLDLTVATGSLLAAIADAARRLRLPRPASVHIKADTGMHRYGAAPEEAVTLARQTDADSFLRLAGFSTHFASADEPDESFTREQVAVCDQCLEELASSNVRPERVHAANSAATLRSRRYDYDLVRVGIALYGLPPSEAISLPSGMRSVLTLRSRIARIFKLKQGDTVGYGRSYRATEDERAALIPIGYADGYRRALSNRGWMGLHGHPAPVRGWISMDQTVIAVPKGIRAKIGDDVLVAGEPGDDAPSVVDLARLLDTIPYEVVTSIAARVPRHFVSKGEVLSTDEMPAYGAAADRAPGISGSNRCLPTGRRPPLAHQNEQRPGPHAPDRRIVRPIRPSSV